MSEGGPPAGPSAGSDRELRRALGLGALVSISIGGIIGSGWLFGVLRAASIAGPASILAWIVGGALSLVLAVSWARMSEVLPRSGATARYVFYSHGSFGGFLVGWIRVLSVVTIPPIEAEAVVTALQVVLSRTGTGLSLTRTVSFAGAPITTLDPLGIAIALALLIAFFLLNARGVGLLGEATKYGTVWKLVVPGVTIAALLAVARPSNFTVASAGGPGGFLPYGWSAVFYAVATSGVMFAYLGFAQVVDYGGEARRPRRDLPVAVLASTAIAATIYILLEVAFLGGVNWSNAGVPVGRWNLLAGSPWGELPLYAAITAVGGAAYLALGYVLLSDAAFSPTQTGWIYLGTGARSIYGLGVEGYLPKGLTALDPVHRVPTRALLASLALGALFLLPLPSWYELVAFISGALVVSYAGAPIALPVFARHAPGRVRGSGGPGPTGIALAGFLVVALVLYWTGFTVLTWLIVTVYAGIAIFVAYAAPRQLGVPVRTARLGGLGLGVGLGLLAALGPTYASWTGATSVAAPLWSVRSGAIDAAYLALVGIWAAAAIGLLVLRTPPDRRRGIVGGAVLVGWLYATYLISYVGEFGPVASPLAGAAPLPGSEVLRFPYGTLLALAVGVLAFVGLVRSGYATAELVSATSEPPPA